MTQGNQTVTFRAEFFREDDVYVGLAPELDVSSYGENLDDAKRSLQEAVDAFLEECEAMGSFAEVMEEAGFERHGNRWLPHQPVSSQLMITG